MSQPPKIVIKKYENRRLYDTSNSRYINLEEVAEMVRKGGEVQVVDAKTNEDLTRTVLTQIIVEETKGRELGLPLELLRQLVLASDSARQRSCCRRRRRRARGNPAWRARCPWPVGCACCRASGSTARWCRACAG